MRSIMKAGRLVLAAVALVTAACNKDGSGPNGGSLSDPAALEGELEAVNGAFATEQFASYQSLDELFDFGAMASPSFQGVRQLVRATRPSPADLDRSRAEHRAGRALALRMAGAAWGSPAAAPPSIPSGSLGVTYEWDEGSAQYADFGTPGAPSNGVRFVLYAIDPFTGEPASPLNPVGRVDIVEQGTSSSYSVNITVVGDDGVTYADYDVTATPGASSFSASSAGHVSDGTARLDFSLSASASQSSASFDVTLALDQPDVSASLSYDVALGNTSTTITADLTFGRSGESVRVQGSTTISDDGQGNFSITNDYTVRVNGGLFCTIEGEGQNVTIVDEHGDPLTQQELAAVQALFALPADAIDGLSDLLDPAFDMLGLQEPAY